MSYSSENTKGIWSLGIVVVLLTLGGVFAYLEKPPVRSDNNSTSSTTIPVVIEGVEDWRILVTNRFSLRYPTDLTLITSTTSTQLLVPVKTYFKTILANEAYITVYEPQSECPPSQGETFEATTTLSSLDQTVFSKVVWSGIGAGQFYKGADYTAIHDGKCYKISVFTHSANGAALYFTTHDQIERTDKQHKEDMDAFFALVDKSVTSFQFITTP
jgi:hypothetical protein